MHGPRDVVSLGVGAATAGIGGLGLTAGDVQLVLSIIASSSGIVLTILTLYWRRGENRRRVKEFKDYQERIERLEDAQEECSERDDKDG